MNTNINSICIFLGGAIVGSFATVGVMKKLGYHKDGNGSESDSKGSTRASEEEGEEFYPSSGDVPSFDPKRVVDTHKTRYDTIREKPDPDDIIRSYAEREHTREDSEDEDDGESDFPTGDLVDENGERIIYPKHREYTEAEKEAIRQANIEAGNEDLDDEEAYQMELGEAGMIEETDGFGHVIAPLLTNRKDALIYLIPEAYLGEIYNVESLTYYERDNVLTDISDIPVDNVTQIIGDALEHFGECLGETETNEEVVYVRNCSLGVEYEITRVDRYYGAHLYGVSDEDFEGGGMAQLPRKITKRKNTQQEED